MKLIGITVACDECGAEFMETAMSKSELDELVAAAGWVKVKPSLFFCPLHRESQKPDTSIQREILTSYGEEVVRGLNPGLQL